MSITLDRTTRTVASIERDAPLLSIAMLAPPWIAVPPAGYGGVETVVADLTEALVERGHDVTLFCAPGSHSSAKTVTLLDEQHPGEIERSLYEADHVARAFAAIDLAAEDGSGFDIVHDHCGFTALAMADRLETPLLHTLHGPFTRETAPFYEHHAEKAWVAGISDAQLAMGPESLRSVGAIPNPIAVDSWPFQRSDDGYLLWIGRMTPEKGPHRAIEIARAAGQDLILAGVVQPGQRSFFERHIEPHIDGRRVRFVGEVGGARKKNLFAGARALLVPIRWPEPYGMVIIEALVCGTPVLAFDEGAVTELVDDGVTGFVVEDETAMVAALANVKQIDPAACRRWVAEHCDVNVVAAAYEAAYHTVLRAGSAQGREPADRAFGGFDGVRVGRPGAWRYG
jgi:glycosyltransferase involved in cell wall biosynthesis